MRVNIENITFSLLAFTNRPLTSSDVSLSDHQCYKAVQMEPVVPSVRRFSGVSLRFTEASINTHCLVRQKKHSSLIRNHLVAVLWMCLGTRLLFFTKNLFFHRETISVVDFGISANL